MTRSRIAGTLLVGLLLALVAGPAVAEGETIPVNVLVTHLSKEPGGIDPGGRFLHGKLQNQFRYESLKVITKKRIEMTLDEVSRFDLPNGKAVHMRPIHKGEGGVLMAVDVEGAAKLDARVKSHKPLVIRAGPYKKGSLVLSLELDY